MLAEAMRLLSDTKKNDYFEPLNLIQVRINKDLNELFPSSKNKVKSYF